MGALPKLEARVVPYSSVVGSSVSLIAEDGSHFAMLGVMGVDTRVPSADLKATQIAIAEKATAALNAYGPFGLALMMIREGCANPDEVARAALAKQSSSAKAQVS